MKKVVMVLLLMLASSCVQSQIMIKITADSLIISSYNSMLGENNTVEDSLWNRFEIRRMSDSTVVKVLTVKVVNSVGSVVFRSTDIVCRSFIAVNAIDEALNESEYLFSHSSANATDPWYMDRDVYDPARPVDVKYMMR